MASYDQGYQLGAKLGTVFYGESATGDWAEMASDLSQEATSLEDGGDVAYASNDPRFDRAAPRTVHLRIEVADVSDGTLYAQGDEPMATPAARLYIDMGVLVAEANGVVIGQIDLLAPVSAEVYHVAWLSEPNPDTTGASDVEASWLIAYNVTSDVPFRSGPFFHESLAGIDVMAVFGGIDVDANDPYRDVVTICGFHHRAMTLREILNDHVSTATALSTDCSLEREAIPLSFDMGVSDEDQCYGPVPYWAARNTRQLRRRTVTARVERFTALTFSTAYADTEWIHELAGTAYGCHQAHELIVPVAPTVNRFWVRLHAKLWVVSGAAVPTGLRVVSSNRPLRIADEGAAEPLATNYIEEVATRDDTASGVGEWMMEDFLTIERGAGLRQGWTYVSIAWAFDPGSASANDANARLEINALHLCPCYATPVPGGPGVLPGEGA